MTSIWFSSLLLLFIQYVSSLIVPEELPTIVNVIFSELPPIKKGVDSRVGVGFRFGEHADFQIIMELGPQYDTTPLKHPKSPTSTEDSKRKREAIMYSALKGDLGPWAQSIAKHQMERKSKNVLNRQRANQEKRPKTETTSSKRSEIKRDGNDWLSTWSRGLGIDLQNVPAVEHETTRNNLPHVNRIKVVNSQSNVGNQSIVDRSDLQVLKAMFGNGANSTGNSS